MTSTTTVTPPNFDTEIVADAVEEKFGLTGEYIPLVSERDQNFRLQTKDGSRFVVKVTSATQDRVVTDFQINALIHLEKHGLVGVPRIVRTVSGEHRSTIQTDDGSLLCLRVVTWLDGDLLDSTDVTPKIAERVGERLAELDAALGGFVDEVDVILPLWDTTRAGELRSLLVHVDDGDVRQELEVVLDRFDQSVTPALDALPRQVIHNDANTENILLDDSGDVSGFIDFGDMMRAPRIIEVSTAASYLRATGDDRLRIIAPFVAGYHHRNPLTELELDLLFDLIRTRLSMTLIILYWRLMARGEDDPYCQKTLQGESDAFEFLKFLSRLGRAAFDARIGIK